MAGQKTPDPELIAEVEALRDRLARAEYTLKSIRGGEADALVVAGRQGDTVHILDGRDRLYRQFIEAANGGTATLSASGDILACNVGLAATLRRPFEQLIGTPMSDHLSPEDREALSTVLEQPDMESNVREIHLVTGQGGVVPVFVSSTLLWTAENAPLACLVFTDVGEVVSAQRTVALQHAVQDARLRLLEVASNCTLDELLEKSIDEAEEVSESRIGFYHFVDPDQINLTLQNWSTRTKAGYCSVEGKGLHYPIESAGVWVDCVKARAPVTHNDYASLRNRKGLPEGHGEVVRELVVPVMRHGKVTAILGVGNKSTLYDQEDVEAVAMLADLAWGIAESKIASDALKESEERYRLLFENMNEGVVFQTTEGKLSANRAARQMLGLAAGESGSATAIDSRWQVIHEDGSVFPSSEHPAMVSLRTGLPVPDVIMGLHNPTLDELRWLHVSAVPVFESGSSSPHEVFLTLSDITELKRSNQDMKRANELLSGLQDVTSHLLSNAALEDSDVEAALRAIGVAAEADCAYISAIQADVDETVHTAQHPFVWRRPNGGVTDAPSRAELESTFAHWREHFSAGAAVSAAIGELPDAMRAEFRGRGVSSVLAVPIFSEGRLWGFVALEASDKRQSWDSDVIEMVRSATSRMGTSIQVGNRALRDPLTGLYNRRYLEEALGQALARSAREDTPLSVVMFDIDHFKDINDSHGHDVGDAVLREVSHRLRERSRAEDTAARLGGDEFVVVMPSATLEAALDSAERWRAFVESDSPTWDTDGGATVTVSVGACSTATAQTARELISQADKALFEAKNAGRNRVQGFL